MKHLLLEIMCSTGPPPPQILLVAFYSYFKGNLFLWEICKKTFHKIDFLRTHKIHPIIFTRKSFVGLAPGAGLKNAKVWSYSQSF